MGWTVKFTRMTDELTLTVDERALLAGESGAASAMAMRVVSDMARILGAPSLVEVVSAHIDGCLYHGDSGTEFAEHLRGLGGTVAVPSTLNVGGLDLLRPNRVAADPHRRDMAGRQMAAYVAMGCRPTWTCAPYQAGHRPEMGQQVAWGESNAVVFANSVLGARTNRYGDFLDICCAVIGRAPFTGLHLDENRRATVVIDLSGVPARLRASDVFYPVLGSWLGQEMGRQVAVLDGLQGCVTEDRLKALGAAAASTGAVGLFHVAGETPEAPDVMAALHGRPAVRTLAPDLATLRAVRDQLSTVAAASVDAIAFGSPHFSLLEMRELEVLRAGRDFALPVYVCTGRHTLDADPVLAARLETAGVIMIADTCVVVAPILPNREGVLMTNSGKFAHYTLPNTGYQVLFGSLSDCIETAVAGSLTRDESLWVV